MYKVGIEYIHNMKALLISDQHFGKTLPLTQSLPQCLKNLMTIIMRENINTLFLLGDLIHIEDEKATKHNKDTLLKVIGAFEQIPIPVFIMGGEHDRKLLWDCKYNKPGSNVHIVYDYLVQLSHPNPQLGTLQNVFLAHDFNNPYSLKPDEVESFVVELKHSLSDFVKPEDYLIIGHCHQFANNEQAKAASLREFSPDLHHNGYAILTCNPNCFDIDFKGK